MRKLAFLAIVFLFTAAAGAQDAPRFEVFGGYSYQHTYPGFDQNGWDASANFNVNRWFGLKADFSGHYGHEESAVFRSEVRVYDFLFGPQFSWRTKRATLFAHGLIGVSHFGADTRLLFPPPIPPATLSPSDNSFAAAVGGGADWNFSEHVGWRVAQVDYLHTSPFGGGQNNVRVATGLVFRFGK